MNNIKWEYGAVCFAYGKQWFIRENKDNDLISWNGTGFANSFNAAARGDFQLNEIRTGDYIEASELDTEQKYNNAVEVFKLFGFYPYLSCFNELGRANTLYVIDDGNIFVGADESYKGLKRQLTYSQIIAIGKLKRMMLEREKSAPKTTPDLTPDLTPDVERKTATDYLQECMEVQKQRGEQYNSKGTGERSFAAIAEAFTAITGKKLVGSDVALIQQILKAVRQYSDPTRVHEDSLLDLVSYASLWAEELNKELS